ncbi:hypothetical protein TNCV_5125961 [Trichonephila clavipes]|nr:hypothetical protein TNCV_5125961 [Trichonephila clavipes]
MIENQEVGVEESFIDFLETKNKTAEGISDMIVSKPKVDGLDIMNCRGQAYDNATKMAGCHTGVQQRIKDINPNAKYVPCSNHSLNLVCVHAPSVVVNSVTFFVILSMDELNLDQAPQDINKEEFQLERVGLQAFVAATEPGCKKELMRFGSLGLLK